MSCTDRYRGTPGLLGWLVWKWDVWYLKRAATILMRELRRRNGIPR